MLGSRGKDVQTLQSLLNLATVPGPGLAADGNFGLKTDSAVRDFQRRKGLKPDGIVGRLTAQALGAAFVQLSQPPPRHDPPGTAPSTATAPPGAVLVSVIAKELKQIHQRIDASFNNGYDEMPEVYDRARKLLKSALNQSLLVLSTAARDGMSAQFVGAQSNAGILAMVGGLGTVAGQVGKGGGDTSLIMAILTDLNARSARVADVVRKTLDGQLDGGLKAGVRLLRDLLESLSF